MSYSAQLQQARTGWDIPPTKPLDPAVWQQWIVRGREQDRRSNVAHTRALKWVVIAALVGAAALGSDFALLQTVVRFLVAVPAVFIMLQSIQARQYVLAAAFGALVIIYNPLAPAFGFSGDWQRAGLAASAVPFVASLFRETKP